MKRFSVFARAVTACLLGVLVASSDPSDASAQGPAGPEVPLQTRPSEIDDSWVQQGWTANILGISGNGKTLLVVSGEKGYVSSAEIDGTFAQKAHSIVEENGPALAIFELADKDHRIVLKVKDPRGAEWSESVDVPRGMKVTVDIKARYIHRGFEGTIKNDRLTCKVVAQRKTLRFEIWQGNEMIGNAITLDPGKSAPGVRLKAGLYDLRVHEKRGREFILLRHVPLDPKQPLWSHDEPCI